MTQQAKEGESQRSRIQRLQRHPVVMNAVQISALISGSETELVMFDDGRVAVIGSLGEYMLRPRLCHPSEREVLAGATSSHEEGTTAVAVRLPGGEIIGAIWVNSVVNEHRTKILERLADTVAYVVDAPRTPTEDTGGFAEAVLSGMRDIVLIIDSNFTITWCSNSVGNLGYSPTQIAGTSAADIIHPDDLVGAIDAASRLGAGHETYRVALRLRSANGEWIPVVVLGMDHTEHPLLNGLVVTVRSDEYNEQNEREVDRLRRMTTAVINSSDDAMIASDPTGGLRLINVAARELFGIAPEVPTSAVKLSDLALRHTNGSGLDSSRHPLFPGNISESEILERAVDTAHGLRQVTIRAERITSDSGTDLGVVMTLHDTTQSRLIAAELKSKALEDQLTGLANRRKLQENIAELTASGGDGDVVACFIDLDGFKSVNDIHGHRIGDVLLRIAGDRLKKNLRATDVLARQGGDEFVALFLDIESEEDALAIGDRLRLVLSEPYQIDGLTFNLTTSIGIAFAPLNDLSEDRLLQQADIALYQAKELGRNRVELFDQELAAATESEQRQRDMVRVVLDDDRLVMQLQPIIDASTGTTVGVESLVRCRTVEGNLIGPGGFLDAIAGTSMMVELDHRAFDLSCEAAAQLAERKPDTPTWVACNFSSVSLSQPDLVDQIMATIEHHGVAPSQICIEITESGAFHGGSKSIQALRNLREVGFGIALDDFGTGYSSLAHLKDLPLSIVKVDKSFIKQLTTDSPERAISSAIVRLSLELGFAVVAEGVETEEQLIEAQSLGFSLIQGWYYDKSLDLPDLFKRLEREDAESEAETKAATVAASSALRIRKAKLAGRSSRSTKMRNRRR